MKLNLGCGSNHKIDYLNVDKFEPADFLCDLEIGVWPWISDTVDEMLFNHSLEHMGQTPENFAFIIRELYRVCKNGAIIQINVPHPRHDDFINDPTHVRIITPELLALLSEKNCQMYRDRRAANSQLATYWKVDFEITNVSLVPSEEFQQLASVNQQEYLRALKISNNVAREFRITLRVCK